MVVGITGGIGSGKTTFCKVLRDRGYLVYDTDHQARLLQNNDASLRQAIQAVFGHDIYNENGLDRKKLGTIVFDNPALLKQLSEMVHPIVRKNFVEWIAQHPDSDLLFVECAILFEGGFDQFTQRNVLITADEQVRIKRVQKRDKISVELIKKRMSNQWPDNKKRALSDYVVYTDDDMIPTETKVDEIIKALLAVN